METLYKNTNEVLIYISGLKEMFCSGEASDIKENQVQPFIDYLFNLNFWNSLCSRAWYWQKVKIVQKYIFIDTKITEAPLKCREPQNLILWWPSWHFAKACFTKWHCKKKCCGDFSISHLTSLVNLGWRMTQQFVFHGSLSNICNRTTLDHQVILTFCKICLQTASHLRAERWNEMYFFILRSLNESCLGFRRQLVDKGWVRPLLWRISYTIVSCFHIL